MIENFRAVHRDGVLAPIVEGDKFPLKEGQCVELSVNPIDAKPAPETLALAAAVYDGLSDEDIAEIERVAFDRSK